EPSGWPIWDIRVDRDAGTVTVTNRLDRWPDGSEQSVTFALSTLDDTIGGMEMALANAAHNGRDRFLPPGEATRSWPAPAEAYDPDTTTGLDRAPFHGDTFLAFL